MTHTMSQKEEAELAFWESRLQQQGVLTNDHFEYFYTTHFGLEKAFFRGKRIVDIGCGPRGSLEWAKEAGIRVGIDPLARAYRKLGTRQHSMQYVACNAENMPFCDASFDVVCSLNSLDHVDDLDKVINEIHRVLAPQGYFLLITDIHRHPTVLEPTAYSWDVVNRFHPELEMIEQKQIEHTVFSSEGFGDIYQSLQRGIPYNHKDARERNGILSAKFRKRFLSAVCLSLTTLFLTESYAASGQKNPAPSNFQVQTAQKAADVLRARCLSCHNNKVKSGGVDLSNRAGALTTNAFTPGKPETSKLAQAVQSGKMPPTGKLPAAEITLLTEWIKAGAAWPASASALHPASPAATPLWSLQPIRRPAVPHTPFDARAVNPIDRFLFARLAAKGLHSSPAADRATLLRRVSIDLTGLPPTPADLDAFLKDKNPNAYEKVVDRLLASSAYGERWGRHWLDVVRYGESTGYEQNHLRPNAWPYRDYVIRAFNEDKPYTQFIAEQLAGDVLAPNDPNVNAATGFLVAGIHDTVGIQTDEGTRQQRSNDLDDMVSTTGAAFLGLSVGCAKCHDHKFDPIPQKDYYRLTACFAGVRHGERALPREHTVPPEQIASLNRRAQSLANDINALDDAARQIVLRQRGGPVSMRPAVNARRNVDDFAPVLARFVRFTVLATRDNSNPCLDELQVFGADQTRNLALAQDGAKATASSLLPGYAIHQVAHLNDGKFGNDWSWISDTPGSGWAQIDLPRPALIQRVVWSRDGAAIPRLDDRVPTRYHIEVSDDGKTWQTVSSDSGRQGSSDYIHPDALRAALTPAQRTRRDALAAEQATVERDLARLQGQSMAYVGQFASPDPIYLLNRGDVMQRIEPVTPGALSCVAGLNADLNLPSDVSEPQRRLALARWIGDKGNPLTARVLVNRVWQHHFGRGLVNTPSDFGRNGEHPTHPELLDWLADDFMKNDWKLKRLHKLIVMSSTYRQSSEVNPKAVAVDAGNQLLWRMPLRRMEAESIRDAILQASGKLDRRMGGPSFALFKYRVVNVAIYEPLESYGPETWRRSVYQQPARAIHDEVLSAFDCPESSQRAPRRDATTTALQALNLLNGKFMVQQAGFLADRVRTETGTNATTQVRQAFRLTFGRVPDVSEQQTALSLVSAQGLPSLCRALLNANEFLYY